MHACMRAYLTSVTPSTPTSLHHAHSAVLRELPLRDMTAEAKNQGIYGVSLLAILTVFVLLPAHIA